MFVEKVVKHGIMEIRRKTRMFHVKHRLLMT